MKKEIRKYILAAIITAVSALAASMNASADTFVYVSTTGYDTNAGTFASPFKTVHRARDYIRTFARPLSAPVTVYLRGGTHYLTTTFVVSPQDGGSAGCTVTYRSYTNETAILSAGKLITGTWAQFGNMWRIYLPEVDGDTWYFTQLFVNGARRTRARDPNTGYFNTAAPGPDDYTTFYFYEGDIKNYTNLTDVVIKNYGSWEVGRQPIKSVDFLSHLVTVQNSLVWGYHYWDITHTRYMVDNAFEALDTPGEWYLNRNTGYLYYWPITGENTSTLQAVGSYLQTTIQINGNPSGATFIDYMCFRNLHFRHNHTAYAQSYWNGQASVILAGAIDGWGLRYSTIDYCKFYNIGEHAIYLKTGSKYNRIYHNLVYDAGGGGIYIGDQGPSSSENVSVHDNTVDNNFIHDCTVLFDGAIGLWVGQSSSNYLTHNEIAGMNYSGVSIGWTWGFDTNTCKGNIFEDNYVHNCGQGILSDFGGIYTLGKQEGAVIRRNKFHDNYCYSTTMLGFGGVYVDEGSSNILIKDNIIYNVYGGAFNQNSGKNCIVDNNILAFTEIGALTRNQDQNSFTLTATRNVVYSKNNEIYALNWDNMPADTDVIDSNCYYRSDGNTSGLNYAGHTWTTWRTADEAHDTHSISSDPHFVDPANGNFDLASPFPTSLIGFVDLDNLPNCGLYGESEWTGLSDSVTYIDYLLPSKIVYTSPARTVIAGGISDTLIIEVRNSSNSLCLSFNDQVMLSSTSASGRFSEDKAVWSTDNNFSVWVAQGVGKFYYKDPTNGTCLISVTKTGCVQSLAGCSQQITVTPSMSYLKAYPSALMADKLSRCTVTCNVRDGNFNPVSGVWVTICATRGSAYLFYDTITQPSAATDANGQCTGTIVSDYTGSCTVTAVFNNTMTMFQNEAPNFSFELGAGVDAYNWAESANETRTSAIFHDGSWCMVGRCDVIGASRTAVSDNITITPNSAYWVSAWMYRSSANVTQNVRVGSATVLQNTAGAGAWAYFTGAWSSGALASATIQCTSVSTAAGTYYGYHDQVRFWRVPTITWAAARFLYMTPATNVPKNYASPRMTVIAAGSSTGSDTDFTFGSTATLMSSSAAGRFSYNGVAWSASNNSNVTFVNGVLRFYYRDSVINTPVITVYRAGMTSGAQIAVIHGVDKNASYISFNSYYAPADGATRCTVTVTVNGITGLPVTPDTVTITVARAGLDTIWDSAGGAALTQTTDANGMCTWSITSATPGYDTVTAICESAVITRGVNRQDAAGIWCMNQDTKDISIYNNSGSATSPLWATAPDSALFGASLRCDGSANRTVSIKDNPSTRFDISNFSFEFWIRPEALDRRLLFKSNFPTGGWLDIDIYPGGQVEMEMTDDSGGAGATVSAGAISVNTWTHLVITVDRVNLRARYYFNGTLNTNAAIPGSFTGKLNVIGQGLTIGSDFNSFVGLMDEARIYKRILSDTDVRNSYNRACGIKFTQAPVKLVFITPERTISKIGAVSDSLVFEVRDASDSRCADFNDVIYISFSSLTGNFSPNAVIWADSSYFALTVNNGSGVFYYKDSSPGNFIITASRADLQPCTQAITVAPSLSYFIVNSGTLPANAVSRCTVVCYVRGSSNNPLQGLQVTIYSARGAAFDSITQPSALTDLNGICTGSIVSDCAGGCTVFAEYYDTATNDTRELNENKALNFSFEDGSGADAYSWAESANMRRSGAQVFSGSWSMYAYLTGVVTADQTATVAPNSTYGVSAWMRRRNSATVTQRVRIAGLNVLTNSGGSNVWAYASGSWNSGSNTSVVIQCTATRTVGTETAFFDDIKFWRVPTVNWAGTRFKFITSPFSISKNYVSPPIVVRVQGSSDTGDTDPAFSNTASLVSSSGTGRFSYNGINWGTSNNSPVTFAGGYVTFYYRDSVVNTPVITVSRPGMQPCTQTELIQGMDTNSSYIIFYNYYTPADGAARCTVTVTINGIAGIPISAETVALTTTRPGVDTVMDSAGGTKKWQTTDANGTCTWSITSAIIGYDTVIAVCAGATVTRGVNRFGAAGIWFLDQNAKDVSAYANSGGGTSPFWVTAPDSALFGASLQCDGSANRSVLVPDNPSLQFGTSNLSFECWVRPGSLDKRVIEKNSWPSTWWTFDITGSGQVEMEVGDAGGNIGSTVSSGSVSANTWTHIVATVDRVNFKTRYYFNGTLDSVADISGGFTGKLNVPGQNMAIGSEYNPFAGLIDEARVYSRVLSDTDVRNSYNRVCGIKFTQVPARVVFITPLRSVPAGSTSDSLAVEVRDASNSRCMDFNDVIYLRSASSSGVFSPNMSIWSDLNYDTLTINNGAGVFYYRDPAPGGFVITAYRSGLISGTQTITVTAPAVAETTSYLRTYYALRGLVPADGTNACTVAVYIKDALGIPVQGLTVTVNTSRGAYETVTYPGGQASDAQGQVIALIKSSYTGPCTVTARCAGLTITENLINNPSFEQDLAYWVCDANTWAIRTDIKYSGNKSLRCTSDDAGSQRYAGQDAYIGPNTVYEISQNVRNDTFSGSPGSIRLVWWKTPVKVWPDDYMGDAFDGFIGPALSGWRLVSARITSVSGATYLTYRCNIDNYIGTVWFDCVRIKRMPTITWSAARFKFTSTAFTVLQQQTSPQISVRAQGGADASDTDTEFSNTATLTSSSPGGRFSADSVSWTTSSTGVLTFSGGVLKFYYRDSRIGSPIISVSREGMQPDSQQVTITAETTNVTASYIVFTPREILANGSAACNVSVGVNNTYGFPIAGAQVVLSVLRGVSDTIRDSAGAINSIQSTNDNGFCTFTITSVYTGYDTIRAAVSGNTITKGINRYLAAGIWHLDQTFEDVSGSLNNGSSVSPLWVTVPDSAAAGSALQLDGTNDKLARFTDNPTLQFGKSDFTIEFWVYKATSDERRVLDKPNWPTTWWNVDINADGRVEMEMGDEYSTAGTVASDGSINTGTWVHIVITVDRTNFQTKYYFNGNLDSTKNFSTAFTGNLNVPGADVYIGSSGYNNFIGYIDEVRIYKWALSPSEAKDSYNWSKWINFTLIAETTSYLHTDNYLRGKIAADNANANTVVVYLKDITSNPIAGQVVTVYSSRGSLDSITYPNGQVSGALGSVTALIRSGYTGPDTITAYSGGVTITENVLVSNPSFELDGAGWVLGAGCSIDPSDRYSGNKSLKCINDGVGDHYSEQDAYIGPGITYRMSQYVKNDTMAGTADSIRFVWWATPAKAWPDDYMGEGSSGAFGPSPADWTLRSVDIVSNASAWYMTYRCNMSAVVGTAWYDCVRVQKLPTIDWTASRLNIMSIAFTVAENKASPPVLVRAQGSLDSSDTDTAFNNTVTLASSSPGGRFSTDAVNWSASNNSVVTFVSGVFNFYYRDAMSGVPVISVSRQGMISSLQAETITASTLGTTASYITFYQSQVLADGASRCTAAVTVTDTQGLPLANRMVVFSTTRPNSDTIRDSMGNINNSQASDMNGMCTFSITSQYCGFDTMRTACAGSTITRGVNADAASGIWHFDQDIKDYSVYGSACSSTSVLFASGYDSAVSGSGIYIDGSTNRTVSVADGPGNQFGTSDLSFEFWIRPEVLDKRLLTKSNFPTGGWFVIDILPGGQVEMEMTDDAGGGGTTNSDGSIQANTWTHLVVTVDRKNFKTRYYFNGILDSVKDIGGGFTSTLNVSGVPFIIGGDWNFFAGHLDEVKVYQRALNDTEVMSSFVKKANFWFTATKLKFTTPSRTTGAGAVSNTITVEAQDILGRRDYAFSNTVSLTSSSSQGIFSQDKVSWSASNDSAITIIAGSASFYYNDIQVGTPILTVSRAGLQSDTQMETVTQGTISSTVSFVTVNPIYMQADGLEACTVTVMIMDTMGNPVRGRQVTVVTSRGSQDTVTQPSATDLNGQCTGYIVSSVAGIDTVVCRCAGLTITQNLVLNSSFEAGSGSSPSPWVGDEGGGAIANAVDANTFGNGSRSSYRIVGEAGVSKQFYQDIYGITANTAYYFEGFSKAKGAIDAAAGFYGVDLWIYYSDLTSYETAEYFSVDTHPFEKKTLSIMTENKSVDYIRIYGTFWDFYGTAWFDDFRIRRVPTIQFNAVASGATQIVITSPQFRIRAGDVSPQIKAVAEDAGGDTDVTFNNTVSLTTASNSGYFSVSNVVWANTSSITFSAGVGTFYYRDYAVGYPVLSAARSPLTTGTQTETISIASLQITNTPGFTITSISTAPIMVRARDGLGNTATAFSETSVVISSSSKGSFSVSGTTWQNTSILYFSAGSVVIFYKDKTGGNPIVTVTRVDSWTWRDTQAETVTKPVVAISKVQYNMRSGETGSMPMRFWPTDTVEYTIYISNTGTETSTGNVIVDTKSFDTSTNNAVDYVYMDTTGYADTWAYTTDLVSWTTGNPASGASNIKGLRWRINSLGINQQKAIRFRVRVK